MSVGLTDLKYFWMVMTGLALFTGNVPLMCIFFLPSVPFLVFYAHRWVIRRYELKLNQFTVDQTVWITYLIYYIPLVLFAMTLDYSHLEL